MSQMRQIDYSQITELDLSNRELTELPDLSMYVNLVTLNCSENNLTQLYNLPPNLKTLDCYWNKITQLDNLPHNLERLYCDRNKLTQLDNLPPNLEILSCGVNKILQLDNLPPNLKELICNINPLQYDFKPTLKNIRNYNAKGTKVP